MYMYRVLPKTPPPLFSSRHGKDGGGLIFAKRLEYKPPVADSETY